MNRMAGCDAHRAATCPGGKPGGPPCPDTEGYGCEVLRGAIERKAVCNALLSVSFLFYAFLPSEEWDTKARFA